MTGCVDQLMNHRHPIRGIVAKPWAIACTWLWLAAFPELLAAQGQVADSGPPPPDPPRWADFVETDFPFFSSVLDARNTGPGWPAHNLTPRGLILNLGQDCWACFDTDLLRVAMIWSGPGITPVSMAQISYHDPGAKAPEGQEKLPRISGTPWLANGIYPGWQTGTNAVLEDPRPPTPDPSEVGRGPLDPKNGRFRSIRPAMSGAVLEYEVAGVLVQEQMTASRQNGQLLVSRSFKMAPRPQPLTLVLGQRPPGAGNPLAITVAADSRSNQAAIELRTDATGLTVAQIRASPNAIAFTVTIGGQTAGHQPRLKPIPSPAPAARWPQTVTTRGTLSTNLGAFVVDNLSLPLANPWRRNIRLADIAFLPDGRAALVTFDGDVWLVSGLVGDLSAVTWRRFTSGFHEPLGIATRGGDLFVFDRNGLWRLPHPGQTGEAEVHELFSDAFAQTAETREFASGLRVAPDGSFVLAKGGQQSATTGRHNGTILRVAANGQSVQVLGWGLRQPFIGVDPVTGMVTASDQEGNYVPATPIHIIRDGQFYGFLSSRMPKEQYPAPIAEPLTWIPHTINASAASQVWLNNARMGPLNGACLAIGYFRPELFLVLLNERSPHPQAAVVSLTTDLPFAPLNGAVNPVDGQLYLTGFQIWGTVAPQISGLARVRYTGSPSPLPRVVAPFAQGILLKFDEPLAPAVATNPVNYSVERWNYRRSAAYGSPHLLRDGHPGQETMLPTSAYLSADGRAVFLGLPDMHTVMQMRVGWAVTAQNGNRLEQDAYLTVHELSQFNPTAEGFPPLTIDLTPRRSTTTIAATPVTVDEGRRLANLLGCFACHSTDGTLAGKVGPTWKGLSGSKVPLKDGRQVVADEAYLRESIREPQAKIVRGFDKSDAGMPSYQGVITDDQIEALVLYLKSLQ